MKRRISLLLAMVMILGSFSAVFASEISNPAGFLEEQGVLKGDKDGNLNLDDVMIRRDSVVMLSRLMGVEKEAKNYDGLPTWTDNKDPHYDGYLAWAQANEYFKGHAGLKENEFGPYENITTVQYSIVLLRALGYGDVDYYKAYETAKELGLLENINKKADEEITRGEMAQLTVNALETEMKDSKVKLGDHLKLDMPAPEVLEAEVMADNLKEIQVKFNRDVDRDNVEDRDIYTTTAGSIKDAELVDNNTVLLTLEGEMKNKKDYKLTVRGLKEGGTEVNKDYKFTTVDNAIPEVVEVVGLGTKAIKVLMTEPVKNVKSSNFAIDGKTYYGSVSTTGREIILKPYGSDFGVGEHTLVVKSLEDYAGFKSVEREIKFEIAEDKEAPTVVDVKGTMERLVVTFSEDVDNATVSTSSLYWGGTKTNKADKVTRLAGNRYAFEFSGSKTLPTYETIVTVTGVKDYSANEMKAQDVAFKAEIDQTRPEVLEVDVDSKEIEVKFNKKINKDDAEDKKNYTITDEKGKKISIKGLELSADGRTVTITLYSELGENKDYTLKITGIRDNTKLANTILPYDEKITAGNYSRPEVTAVTGNSAKETIHVLFNKKMDVETIANPVNYMVSHKTKGNYSLDAIKGDVDVIQDGKAVILHLPEKIGGDKVSGMEFGGDKADLVGVILSGSIKDTAGNRVKDYGTVRGFDEDEVKVKEDGAKATDKRTIELEFTHPITAATASDFVVEGFDIDEVIVNGTKTVKIETKKDLDPALIGVTIEIKDGNKIETVLENKVTEQKDIELTDKIKPTLKGVTGVVTLGKDEKDNEIAKKLTLKLEFDERLSADYEELAKRDLVVRRASDRKLVDMSKDDVKTHVERVENKDGKEITTSILVLETTQNVSKDTAYEVEIVDPSAIVDMSENRANKTDNAVIAEELGKVKEEEVKAEAIAKAKKDLAAAEKDALGVESVIAAIEKVQAVKDAKAKKVVTKDEEYTEEQKDADVEAAQKVLDEANAKGVTEEYTQEEKDLDVEAAQKVLDEAKAKEVTEEYTQEEKDLDVAAAVEKAVLKEESVKKAISEVPAVEAAQKVLNDLLK